MAYQPPFKNKDKNTEQAKVLKEKVVIKKVYTLEFIFTLR